MVSGRKLTTKDFKEKVYELVGNDYCVIGEYGNSRTKILIKHNNEKCHNHIYYVQPSSFLSGNRCPKCNNMRKGRKPKTTEMFKKELHTLVGNEYTLLSGYNGVYNKVILLHNKCGNKWSVTPNAFISSNIRCRHCRIKEHNINQRKSHIDFVKEVQNKYGNDYEILGNYVNSKTKILVKHKCGEKWKIKPTHLLTRDMCPKCKNSIGEKYVSKYLDNLGIKYEIQKKFKDLKFKKSLSYDFYLPKYNILIEYQGLQHYKPIESFGGMETYKSQVKRDTIKRNYAKNNGYILIEISYKYKYYNAIKTYLDNLFKDLLV